MHTTFATPTISKAPQNFQLPCHFVTLMQKFPAQSSNSSNSLDSENSNFRVLPPTPADRVNLGAKSKGNNNGNPDFKLSPTPVSMHNMEPFKNKTAIDPYFFKGISKKLCTHCQ